MNPGRLLLITGLAGLVLPLTARANVGEGQMCGGIAGIECKPGLFCDYKPEAMCGAGDMSGTCAGRPEMCTKIYRPVCGCDDKTYGNDCTRMAAGIGKLKDGACAAPKRKLKNRESKKRRKQE